MNAILTIATGEDYRRIAELTHPTIKKYADKIGADFLIIDKQEISKTTPHWEKFQVYNLLDKYDRILYIDTDVIIREDCPNLFDETPEGKLGMFEEGQFTDRSRELMIDICKNYEVKLPGWNGKYYNSGVIVISQKHKNLFKKPDKEVFNFYEQSYLNMMIAKHETEMHGLHYNFNRMSCMDRFIGEDRRNAFIIHYAGFLFNTTINNLLDLIKLDLERWKNKEHYKATKHLCINVTGGLGDQICAEPAIRFLKEKLYPNDEVVVMTHFPRIFKHLKKDDVEVYEHGATPLKQDTPYFIADTLPGPDKLQWAVVSHLLCSSVDYTAISLMKRTLPLQDKTIKFEIDQKDFDSLKNISGIKDIKEFREYTIVHPGKHWETKTFPIEYWQGIIDGLKQAGKKVVVIGKDEKGDPPDYKAGARGTVDVNCEGVMDLRNRLSLGELGALISQAKVLISNDSAPIHLAGAFNNWIILIPSCKHQDHILPWRNGTQLYKTRALCKKLIIDEVESRPTQVYPTSVDVKIRDWNEYLLEPEKVVKEILILYGF